MTAVVAPILEPVTDVVAPILDPVLPILEPVTDVVAPILEPVTDSVTPILEPILDPVIPSNEGPRIDPVAPPAPDTSAPLAPLPALSPGLDQGMPLPAPIAAAVDAVAVTTTAWAQTITATPPSSGPAVPAPGPGPADSQFPPAPGMPTASIGSDLIQNLRTAGSSLLLAAFLAAAGLILARSWRLIVTDRLVRLPIVFSTVARPG